MSAPTFEAHLRFEAAVWAENGWHGWAECTPDCPWTCWVSPPRPLDARGRLLVALAERDGWGCHYCGIALIPHQAANNGTWVKLDDGWARTEHLLPPTIDHKHPQSRGGSDDLGNLVLACWPCNSEKLTTPYDEFIALRGAAS